MTAVAEEQQSDVLLPRQDSGDSSFRECTDNHLVWGFVAQLVRVGAINHRDQAQEISKCKRSLMLSWSLPWWWL